MMVSMGWCKSEASVATCAMVMENDKRGDGLWKIIRMILRMRWWCE